MKQPSFHDIFQAATNWNNSGGDWPQLEAYLQMSFHGLCHLVHEGQCDEVLSRKIKYLTGPHANTIIKAYIATYEK